VLPHPPGNVRHDFGSGFQLDPKTSIGERLRDSAFDFKSLFLLYQRKSTLLTSSAANSKLGLM